MPIKPTTVEDYINDLTPERKEAVSKLRQVFLENLPEGFVEAINYGMIGYVVPHTLYPEGYHCDPKLPLPFAGLAAQKNSINLYHMGIYLDQGLLDWFKEEYTKQCKFKLDLGKSCIRFKKYSDIPYPLIEDLFSKIDTKNWIKLYEKSLKK